MVNNIGNTGAEIEEGNSQDDICADESNDLPMTMDVDDQKLLKPMVKSQD